MQGAWGMKGKWVKRLGLISIGICLVIDPAMALEKKGVPKEGGGGEETQDHDDDGGSRSVTGFWKGRKWPSEFETIHGLWVDPRGRILVIDKGNNRVNFFNGGGRFLESFGELGRAPGNSMGGRASWWTGSSGSSSPTRAISVSRFSIWRELSVRFWAEGIR